jgi:hypothetical protein
MPGMRRKVTFIKLKFLDIERREEDWENRATLSLNRLKSLDYCLQVSLSYEYFPFALSYAVFLLCHTKGV